MTEVPRKDLSIKKKKRVPDASDHIERSFMPQPEIIYLGIY